MREAAASFVPLEKILDAPVILVTRVFHVLGRVDAIHIDENKIFYGGEDKRGDDKSIGY